MLKKIILLALVVLVSLSASGQVIVNLDNINQYRTMKVRLTLQDAATSEPISFATVYLIPQGDTTITNFSLSDDNGDVIMEDVMPGKYEVNAEMIGYHPYKKVHELKGYNPDLGIIKMEENLEYIDASTITAIGNPITVKQDTIEYNASSFHVGENAMLEDLLKKMPGMEVGDDGSVKVNGEQVDKITVGGKTFFFDDPSMAVKNLPAKIVAKIKVIDQDSEEAEMTGIKNHDSKEKVMDVALKDEYKKGMFGNAKIGGGYTLTPKSGDELTDHKGPLFNANALMSLYGEKDQMVIIANGLNAIDPSSSGGNVYVYGYDYDEFDSKTGLMTTASAGANYNTDRMENLPVTASVSYKYSHKDAKEKTARTSLIAESDNLFTNGFFNGNGDGHTVSASLEMSNKKREKVYFSFEPTFSFSSKQNEFSNSSITTENSDTLNSSVSTRFNQDRSVHAGGQLAIGAMNMGGKKGRNLSFFTYIDFNNGKGNSIENSNTMIGDSIAQVSLLYDKVSSGKSINATLHYSEPFNEHWSIVVGARSSYQGSSSDKIATNGLDGTYNDFYTNITDNRALRFSGDVRAQYQNDNHTISVGVRADATETVNYIKNLGTETTTGKNDWSAQFAPTLDYHYNKDTFNTTLYYIGSSQSPSVSQMSPALNLADATMISAGNIYLKPFMNNYLTLYMRKNNRENFSFVNLHLSGSFQQNGIVQASWYDNNAIRYSIPVNSKKPSYNMNGSLTYNLPFGKERYWTFSTYVNASFNSNKSYQAKSILKGMNVNEFDYSDFMEEFWGDSKGDIFYSGESGFAESDMTTLHYALDLGMKYQRERFNAAVHAYGRNQISRYSLDPESNINTWMHSYSIEAMYTTRSNWEFSSKCNANFYVGYSDGFGAPQFNWNAEISKSIKTVTLSLKAIDLLNQGSRNLNRSVTSEYILDTYKNVLGRYFLFSVAFNFGKMNPKKSQAVQDASWRMAF